MTSHSKGRRISGLALVLPLIAAYAAPTASAQLLDDWAVDAEVDILTRSALDSEGGVYTCTRYNHFQGLLKTSRVDRNGNLLWTQTYQATGGSAHGYWLDVDAEDNVVVVGEEDVVGGGFLVLKYGPAGDLLWKVVHPLGTAKRVVVLPSGDIVVAGDVFNNSNDVKVLWLDPDGNLLRLRYFDNGGASDRVASLALGQGDAIAITGSSTPTAMLTLAYDAAGTLLFSDVRPSTFGGVDVIFGPSGDVYACGSTTILGEIFGYVVRYRRDGTLVWDVTNNGVGAAGWDAYRRIDVNAAGDVLAVGQSPGSGLYLDWGVLALDDAGAIRWYHQLNVNATNDEWAASVDLRDDGVAVVGGRSANATNSGYEAHVALYAADGTLVQNRSLVGSGGPANDVFFDPLGGVVFNSTFQVARFLDAQYDIAGALVRNGLGGNARLLSSVTAPVIGGSWTAQVDTSTRPSATAATFLGYDTPLAGVQTPYGELLIAPEVLGGVQLLASLAPVVGSGADLAVTIPADSMLVGFEVHVQAALVGGGVELVNGLDLVLGY